MGEKIKNIITYAVMIVIIVAALGTWIYFKEKKPANVLPVLNTTIEEAFPTPILDVGV